MAEPWDWTGARRRLADRPGAGAVTDQALAEVRAHLGAAGIDHPDQSHAEAMWFGARCLGMQLAPILGQAATDPTRAMQVMAHLNVVEDLCCAARDLWPPPPVQEEAPCRKTLPAC